MNSADFKQSYHSLLVPNNTFAAVLAEANDTSSNTSSDSDDTTITQQDYTNELSVTTVIIAMLISFIILKILHLKKLRKLLHP